MKVTADDRWTCPECGRTTTVLGTRPDVAAALDAVRAVRDGHTCESDARSVSVTWRCPTCTRETTALGPDPDVHVALAAVRYHHDCGHTAARTMTGPLRRAAHPC